MATLSASGRAEEAEPKIDLRERIGYTSFLVLFSSPSCFKFIKAKFKLVSAHVAKVG